MTWNNDMSAAPRDGRDVQIYCRETDEQFVASWMTSIEEGDGQWIFARGPDIAFIVRDPTHWRLPFDPPQEPHDAE